MSGKPKYWDSWKGKILRAVILENTNSWLEVRELSGLEQRKMFKVVGELQKAGVLEYSKDAGFRILDQDLIMAYQNALDSPIVTADDRAQVHLEWLKSWIEGNETCDASLDNQHFFLDGVHLAEFMRKLIGQAKKSIHVVNPYVDKAGLGLALRDAAKSGVEVLLIARRPRSNRARWAFHKSLVDENVALYYSGYEDEAGGVHSKLLIVDDEIAVVSSMNLTSHSEGANYETGIVTIDREVVDAAKQSVLGIRDEHETKLATMHDS